MYTVNSAKLTSDVPIYRYRPFFGYWYRPQRADTLADSYFFFENIHK